MFGFGKRTPNAHKTKQLGWDLHAHLLPAVDDGVRSTEESLESIRALQRLGYSGCVITPHVYKDLYNNARPTLQAAFLSLKTAIKDAGIDFGIHLAAEYFGDQHLVDLAQSADLLTLGLGDSRSVLIEFPYIGEPLYWADTLSGVTSGGYRPVIAHPERYRYLTADMETWLARFGHYGVEYQCDLGSLVGQYGREALRTARVFLEKNLAKYWGSDIHRPSQVDRFIRPAVDILNRPSEINFTDPRSIA